MNPRKNHAQSFILLFLNGSLDNANNFQKWVLLWNKQESGKLLRNQKRSLLIEHPKKLIR